MDTNKGMTIKEIAVISNVSESTIRRWIEQIGKMADQTGKMALLSARMAEAHGREPARFTLEEVLAIIRGVGKKYVHYLQPSLFQKNFPPYLINYHKSNQLKN